MDRITTSLIKDFLATQEREATNSSDDFELFAGYLALSNEYSKTFDVGAINVGAGDDTGIDSIAILVNGQLVEDTNEVDDLLESNGYLEVAYVFVQAKTSPKFDTQNMRTFYFGVQDFFSEKAKLKRNSDIEKFVELSEHILNYASHFRDNPKCKTYYISTGLLQEDQNVNGTIESAKEDLTKLYLFSSLEMHLLGAKELQKLYRKTKEPVSCKFQFASKVTLPDVDGIDEAYFGILPFKEFKNLLIDENENIRSVFDDNVRDFQGAANLVNSGIEETLSSSSPTLFGVLNNGVTIVADSIKASGNTFTVIDYQIVNGCQTSNILYLHRDNQDIAEISIPIRLIATKDENVKTKITVSTNNQTTIKKEQLSATSDFQRSLQHYYEAIEGEGKLYYERRSKEFHSDDSIVKRKIVTIANQIKSFSSMFRRDPHLVTTYFGSIAKTLGEKDSGLFEETHQYAPYYLAGLALYRLDGLFLSGEVDRKYRKVKFYILMLIPRLASQETLTHLNSERKCEEYCKPIISKLNKPAACKELFLKAVDVIDKAGVDLEDKQALKSRKMTDDINDTYKVLYP